MILDTNALSALADGSAALEAVAARVERFSIPVITLGEFAYGILRSRHRGSYRAWLAELIDVSEVIDIDRETAARYALIREQLRSSGRPIPSNDAWIAALSLQHGLPVLSRDGHFDQVDGVRRISW